MNNPEATVKEYVISQYPRKGAAMVYYLRTDKYRYIVWLGNNYRTTEPYEDKFVLETELYDYEKDSLEEINETGNPEYEQVMADLHSKMLSFISGQ